MNWGFYFWNVKIHADEISGQGTIRRHRTRGIPYDDTNIVTSKLNPFTFDFQENIVVALEKEEI